MTASNDSDDRWQAFDVAVCHDLIGGSMARLEPETARAPAD
jgi:hypothetical protein